MSSLTDVQVAALKKKVQTSYGKTSINKFPTGNITEAKFVAFLNTLCPTRKSARTEAADKERIEDRTSDIISAITASLPRDPTNEDPTVTIYPYTLLDIGGADGTITAELAKQFGIPPKRAFLLDPKGQKRSQYTVLGYDKLGRIPLEDGSVELVCCIQVLHHVQEQDRANLYKEIARVLAPGGVLYIRDHDSPTTEPAYTQFDLFIRMIHQICYVCKKETPDGQYLTNFASIIESCIALDMYPESQNIPSGNNPQAVGSLVFKKTSTFDSYETEMIFTAAVERLLYGPIDPTLIGLPANGEISRLQWRNMVRDYYVNFIYKANLPLVESDLDNF